VSFLNKIKDCQPVENYKKIDLTMADKRISDFSSALMHNSSGEKNLKLHYKNWLF